MGRAGGTTVKEAARQAVTSAQDELVALSHRIHAHPELGFEEHRAAAWVGEALTAGGFSVEAGVADLPTALVATAGSGPLTVGVCAEYDALPTVGHACGHNVIAAAAVAAGRALAAVADDVGLTVKVFGTPAEEGGGGKILMLERGVFVGVDAAMMIHPAPQERADPPTLAVAHLNAEYVGRPAHASAFPEDGINAADALTIAQVAIGLLRQHIRGSDRIHGIVTAGGDAPNIVPAYTRGAFYVRSATLAALAELEPRVRACFEAGALATGASLTVSNDSPPYSEFAHNPLLLELYRANAEALGRVFPVPTARDERMAGSTDMANVSLAVPTIQPMMSIESGTAGNHQPEFAAYCVRPAADRALLDGGVAMAWTAIELATRPGARDQLSA
ncbi:MAG: M20 family metallopeptidase [Actinomycetota bacterium]|nr:M20 family metallopeptidase [Actinomycetota bacterium]